MLSASRFKALMDDDVTAMMRPSRRTNMSTLLLAAGTSVLGFAVGAVFAWLAFGRDLGNGDGDDAATFSSGYPVVEGGFNGQPRVLSFEDLVLESDLVVVTTVGELSGYKRTLAGNPDLTAVIASYPLKIEEYLKGSGGTGLELQKVVAYESPTFEATYLIDSLTPLAEGDRYIMALITVEGGAAGAAEPFRFKLVGGAATAESTLSGLDDFDLAGLGFPEKSEAETKQSIATIVATADSAGGD